MQEISKQNKSIVSHSTALQYLLVLFAFLFLMTTNVLGANYYIDPNGNDRNDGLNINTPWKTLVKGIQDAKPGDTVYLREGVYRQSISLGGDSLAHFATNASKSSRIVFKSYPGEQAVISSMKLRNKPEYWEQVPSYKNIFMTAITPSRLPGKYLPERVPNCSQNGIPLMLMTDTYTNGGPKLLTGPGQWVRNTNPDVLNIYVWSRDGKNPGLSQTEICEFPWGGSSTIGLYCNRSRVSKKPQPDFITFEDLTIEGGYHALSIETNNIEVRNCVIRNSYSCGIKVGGAKPKNPNKPDDIIDVDYYNSLNVRVTGCDISYFGYTGIDLTGGDDWIIENSQIHHGIQTRNSDNKLDNFVSAAIVLKNNCKRAVVQKNKIFDINPLYGAITIGGSSWSGVNPDGSRWVSIADEAVDCIVRENEIYNVKGDCAVLFMAANNCTFRDNLVRDSQFSNSLIRFASVNTNNKKYVNRDCSIVNNVFFNNKVSSGFMYKIPRGRVVNLKSDYNTVQPSLGCFYNDEPLTIEQFRELGYEENSKTKISGIEN